MLLGAVIISVFLVVNSAKKIMMFRDTSEKIGDFEVRLDKLKHENQDLKQELEYKKSDEFVESEIRNKLGLAKEGEVVFLVPKEESGQLPETSNRGNMSNWQKWWNLFFGG